MRVIGLAALAIGTIAAGILSGSGASAQSSLYDYADRAARLERGSFIVLLVHDDRLIVLDRNSIRWAGSIATANWEVIYASPKVMRVDGRMRYHQRTTEIGNYDCNGRVRSVMHEYRTLDDTKISDRLQTYGWEQIRPNTLAELAEAVICRDEVGDAVEVRDLNQTMANFLNNLPTREPVPEVPPQTP